MKRIKSGLLEKKRMDIRSNSRKAKERGNMKIEENKEEMRELLTDFMNTFFDGSPLTLDQCYLEDFIDEYMDAINGVAPKSE